MEIVKIGVNVIDVNNGQIDGLQRNPRTITKADITKIANSIKETPELFDIRPCIVYPLGGRFVLIGGNLRFLGAVSLKYKTIPCVVLSADTPVEKLREIVIKDNGSFGAWDYDLLANEWNDVPLTDWGVDVWETEAEKETEAEAEKDVKEDDFDEEKETIEKRCQPGDLWQLGEHRLICGDCTKADTLRALLDGERADLVFSDPPYGYNYQSNRRKNKYEVLKNDDKIIDFISPLKDYLNNCAIYSFCGWQTVDKWFEYFKSTELKIKNLIVWKKNNWCMGDLKCSYAGQYELCFMLNNGKRPLVGARDTDIWEFEREASTLHPTMKPIKLIAYALKKSSCEGEIVLDVFGGSGSTLIACEQLARRCRMVELDPHYCDVIIARWEKITGNKAVKMYGEN